MKKLIAIALVALMATSTLALTSCGGNNASSAAASSSQASSAASSSKASSAVSSKAASSKAASSEAQGDEETTTAAASSGETLSEDDFATLIAVAAIVDALKQDDATTAVQNALINGGSGATWAISAVKTSDGQLVDRNIAAIIDAANGDTAMTDMFNSMAISFAANGKCAVTLSSGEQQEGTYAVDGTNIAITYDTNGETENIAMDAETGALYYNTSSGATLYFGIAQ